MARHTYVAQGYSNYNDFPDHEGGYAYMPEQHVKLYVVETTRVERVHGPATEYTRFGVAPFKNELLKGNMPKYAPMDRHGSYQQYYRPGYEHSSPYRYHDGENLMANFLNKLEIGARPPINTNNHSSTNKYRPTSPNKHRPKSPDKYRPVSPNRYHPTSPNKYSLKSPNKYQSTSPNKYHPTSPKKYRPESLNKYQSTSPTKFRPTSPDKYRPKSPHKYQSTSPSKNHPTSPNKYHPESPNKNQPTSPNKYRPSSPTKYWPTSSTYTYPSKEANMMKPQALLGPNKYRPTSPTKYQPTSPTHNYLPEEDLMNKPQNKPGPNKYRPTSPVHNFPSKEGKPIRTQSFSHPNNNHSSGHGAKDGQVDLFGPNYNWQSGGPLTTRRPLMTPTNNIDEALGSLMESVNYSPQSNPTREGAFGNMSPRAQPIEHERQYARTAYGGVTNRPYLRSNTIDSHEAVRRYNGAYVP